MLVIAPLPFDRWIKIQQSRNMVNHYALHRSRYTNTSNHPRWEPKIVYYFPTGIPEITNTHKLSKRKSTAAAAQM
ncbi:MAG: hypothetical protein GY820_00075 [Gammaproteobacteria bacterium]|nr:hypothetical protein [Gammaproteobacteria bacterium]